MSTAVAKREKSPTKFDVEHGGLQITDSSQMFQMADSFSKSGLVPQAFRNKPVDIMIAWQRGAEVGLKPMEALEGIAVINGKPTIWGQCSTKLVQKSGLMEWHKEDYEGQGDNLTAVYTVKRKGWPDPNEFRFSVADAKKAGLWGKSVWASYPKDMLMWKAKARAYKSVFADALGGFQITQDLQGHGAPAKVTDTTPSGTPPTSSILDDDEPETIDAEYDEPEVVDVQPEANQEPAPEPVSKADLSQLKTEWAQWRGYEEDAPKDGIHEDFIAWSSAKCDRDMSDPQGWTVDDLHTCRTAMEQA